MCQKLIANEPEEQYFLFLPASIFSATAVNFAGLTRSTIASALNFFSYLLRAQSVRMGDANAPFNPPNQVSFFYKVEFPDQEHNMEFLGYLQVLIINKTGQEEKEELDRPMEEAAAMVEEGKKRRVGSLRKLGMISWMKKYFINKPIRKCKPLISGVKSSYDEEWKRWAPLWSRRSRDQWINVCQLLYGRELDDGADQVTEGSLDMPHWSCCPLKLLSLDRALTQIAKYCQLRNRNLDVASYSRRLKNEFTNGHTFTFPQPSNAFRMFANTMCPSKIGVYTFPHIRLPFLGVDDGFRQLSSIYGMQSQRLYHNVSASSSSSFLCDFDYFKKQVAKSLAECKTEDEVKTTRLAMLEILPLFWTESKHHGSYLNNIIRYSNTYINQHQTYVRPTRSCVVFNPDLDPFGNYISALTLHLKVIGHVNTAVKPRIGTRVTIHDSTRDDGNLRLDLVLHGPGQTGKSYNVNQEAKYAIPGTVTHVSHASQLSETVSDPVRGFCYKNDDVPGPDLGIEAEPTSAWELMRLIMKGVGCNNSRGNCVQKQISTGRQMGSMTMSVVDGQRINVKAVVTYFGNRIRNTNANLKYAGSARATRYTKMAFTSVRKDHDMVTFMRSAIENNSIAYKQKMEAAKEDGCRYQCIVAKVNTLTFLDLMDKVNMNLHNLFMDCVTQELERRGIPSARLARTLEIVSNFARCFTIWRAVYVLYDMGLGVVDPRKPFKFKDLYKLSPFLICILDVSLFAIEFLCEQFEDPHGLTVRILLKKHVFNDVCAAASERKTTNINPAMKRIFKDSPTFLTSDGYYSKALMRAQAKTYEIIEQLATQLHAMMTEKPDAMSVMACLFELCCNCVPTATRNGDIVNISGIKIEHGNFMIHKSLIDHAHYNALWETATSILPVDMQPRRVVRGFLKDYREFAVGQIPHSPDSLDANSPLSMELLALDRKIAHVKCKIQDKEAEADRLRTGNRIGVSIQSTPRGQSVLCRLNEDIKSYRNEIERYQARSLALLSQWGGTGACDVDGE